MHMEFVFQGLLVPILPEVVEACASVTVLSHHIFRYPVSSQTPGQSRMCPPFEMLHGIAPPMNSSTRRATGGECMHGDEEKSSSSSSKVETMRPQRPGQDTAAPNSPL
jgi:hypothetical protein